ncbi:uncharacterized protein LOC131597553 [Vicia villosa]|uniref:uncharacterized protein LOC131597553 n=1 Tax=Vicia villosa TaxID=3911 RepID=UPI00273C98D6|nr:uncharacterized protein LOC131597553 [Vicia villosa]
MFCVLIDESGDVAETSAKSLKEELEKLLSINGLSFSSISGQGYDGASNIQGKFAGLITLIQNKNPSSYYVRCFAQQLQLTLSACAKTHKDISDFFPLWDKQVTQFAKLIEEGLIETSNGLNKESSIVRVGDTRLGFHFRTLTILMTLYDAIIGMVEILGFTNDLSEALQKRGQDLLNFLPLVNAAKQELQQRRNDGWEGVISNVMEICNKHDIDVLDMDAPYVQWKKPMLEQELF